MAMNFYEFIKQIVCSKESFHTNNPPAFRCGTFERKVLVVSLIRTISGLSGQDVTLYV